MQRKVIQELKKTTFLIFLFIFLVPYLFVSKPVQQTIKQPKIKPSIIEKQPSGRFMLSMNVTQICHLPLHIKNELKSHNSFERAELTNVKKCCQMGHNGLFYLAGSSKGPHGISIPCKNLDVCIKKILKQTLLRFFVVFLEP